jgi:hypothetical protein
LLVRVQRAPLSVQGLLLLLFPLPVQCGRCARWSGSVEPWMTPAEFDLLARCDYKLPTVKCLANLSLWAGLVAKILAKWYCSTFRCYLTNSV